MFLVPMTRSATDLARNFDRLFDDGFQRFFAPSAQGNSAARSRRWTCPSPNAPTPSSSTCPVSRRKT